jgi:hypothetical protein
MAQSRPARRVRVPLARWLRPAAYHGLATQALTQLLRSRSIPRVVSALRPVVCTRPETVFAGPILASRSRPWSARSTTATDWTLHQLAPYIGRLKTSIARHLIAEWTSSGDLVVDPFSGSGVIALEAAVAGRRVAAGDWNPYAVLLTRAKLFPPDSLESATDRLFQTWHRSRTLLVEIDLRTVPPWVRAFFHPETLRSALAFRDACVERDDAFLLACLLGILHHQRPGFLSFPSSHLVPYLRDRKFPRRTHPHLYEERDVLSRLAAKLKRSFRRPVMPYRASRTVYRTDARDFPRHSGTQAVITSPPYMNALDYVRDNRLRLWFLGRSLPSGLELVGRGRDDAFAALMRSVCLRLAPTITPGGTFVLVLGDTTRGNGPRGRTAAMTRALFTSASELARFQLVAHYKDRIPDVRRSRHECRGTKTETVLVYAKH